MSRYINFILTRENKKIKYVTHYHHILPKAVDFFPEFKNLREHQWNGIYLTAKEHFIAHRMLHRAFPGSSQSLAFYNMSNEMHIIRAKDYDEARKVHIESLKKYMHHRKEIERYLWLMQDALSPWNTDNL